MDNTDVEILEEDLNQDDLFINNMNSTLAIKRDYEKMQYDYEWLDMLEEVIPYIDNILRNPKRFIVNEEEIVKVELAKRVTVESVIHLTQHTNLIQDINEEGDVQPSKILNINREESLDTYENRFVFTLINNTRQFFDERVATSGDSSYYMDKKDMNYEANTKVGTDNIQISLKIHSVDKNIEENKNDHNMSYADRIKNIKLQLDGFTGSELYTTLNKLHVPAVRSPIRKTNVILKNPNFKKAEELWNYIQTFEVKDRKEFDKKDYFDNTSLKNDYDHALLMTYIANRSISNTGGVSENRVITEMIQRLIENILDTDSEITEDKLKEIFNKQIKLIKERNKAKAQAIFGIVEDRLKREIKYISNDVLLLGDEG